MKNKITLVATVFAMTTMVSLSGCGASKDAYTLYTQANEKIESAESYSLLKNTTITINAQDEQVSSSNSIDVKKVVKDKDNSDLIINLTSAMNGETYNQVNGTYTDGYMYFTANDQKYKEALSYNDVFTQMDIQSYTLEKDVISESTVTDDADGGKSLSFVFDNAAMTSAVDKNIESLKQALGASEENLEISAASLNAVTYKNGDLKSFEFNLTATLNGDTQVPFEYNVTADYTDIGSTTIEIPNDLDTYTDVSTFEQNSELETQESIGNETTEGETQEVSQ